MHRALRIGLILHSTFRRHWISPAAILMLGLFAFQALAENPTLRRFLPSALAPGREAELILEGDHLKDALRVWTSFKSEITSLVHDGEGRVRVRIRPDPETPEGIGVARLLTPEGVSNWQPILIDTLPGMPVVAAPAPAGDPIPVLSGTAIEAIPRQGKWDRYRIETRETIWIEVVARRLGFATDPFVRWTDAQGRQRGFVEDSPGVFGDVRMLFAPGEGGAMILEIRDSGFGGGDRHGYRLRVGGRPVMHQSGLMSQLPSGLNEAAVWEHDETGGQPSPATLPAVFKGQLDEPGDRDEFPLNARKDETWVLRGWTRSIGSSAELKLRLISTNGTTLAESDAVAADEGRLTNRFDFDGTCLLQVEELNGAGGAGYPYEIEARPAAPFGLSTEMDRYIVSPGREFEVKLAVATNATISAIQLEVHEKDWNVTPREIPSDKREAAIKIRAAADAVPGTLIPIRLAGRGRQEGREIVVEVGTGPVLKKELPGFPIPPELDGVITVGIVAGPAEEVVEKDEPVAKPAGTDP